MSNQKIKERQYKGFFSLGLPNLTMGYIPALRSFLDLRIQIIHYLLEIYLVGVFWHLAFN